MSAYVNKALLTYCYFNKGIQNIFADIRFTTLPIYESFHIQFPLKIHKHQNCTLFQLMEKNIEHIVTQEDCLDFICYEMLLTRKHKCRLDCFQLLQYQKVICDVKNALYARGLHIPLWEPNLKMSCDCTLFIKNNMSYTKHYQYQLVIPMP